jgi:preprotein translocase subunit SecA
VGLFDKILRAGEGKKVKFVESVVPEVNAFEPEVKRLDDDALAAKTGEFRSRIDRGEHVDDLLPEAFAVVREAASRVLGQRHYDVQIMGGSALHFGWVAEMKTGEGKTLVSTLPAYLNALPGKGVHLVTVNDYLASRDAEWMGRVHRFLGLSVGLVVPGVRDAADKRKAYGADITYGTNNELGFDYLRDNMATSLAGMVQRGHHYAVVDEVDSILIDEARTPLIISGRMAEAAELYHQFARVVGGLTRDTDYEVDEKKRAVTPTEAGIAKVEAALGVENLYEAIHQDYVHQLVQALKAKELFKRDVDYLVADGQVKIVDEFTGRILEGRRWSEGLHQAVEAKERVKIKEENQTLATITLQNYFRLYEKLAGMTGTALTEAGEFVHTYELDVVPIATNRPSSRLDQGDLIYKTEDAKFGAVIDDIVERNEAGQPVLVGTVSVEVSERLSGLLTKRGIDHRVLNAKQHTAEAEVVTQAGRLGSVTVATNMAGRGVDILLGGNPEGLARLELRKEAASAAEGVELSPDDEQRRFEELVARFKPECDAEGDKVREAGGLYVLGTERHESRRIDNQLRGRSGRQGDPGESRFYLSLEDDLMRLFASGAASWVFNKALPDDLPIEAKMVTKAIERAQRTVEEKNFEIRKNVLKYDEVMNQQRKVIYARRQQILEGADLRELAIEWIQEAIARAVDQYCGEEDDPAEWDLDALLTQIKQSYPCTLTLEQLREHDEEEALALALEDDAIAQYEAKEAQIGADQLREIERRVMLSVIDRRWREHLYEMDYLQEGINLRAMGQKDPLSEWQREGFDMFEAMMAIIQDDFTRYVFHLEVVKEQPQPQPVPKSLEYSAPESPEQPTAARPARTGPTAGAAAVAAAPAAAGAAPATRPARPQAAPAAVKEPARVEKVPGRNDPCHCGSGKKYKMCHGRPGAV